MQALVLKKTSYGESDLVVHFLCANGSQLSGFAAGAKRSKNRFPHRFSCEGLYEVDGLQSEKLARIHHCEILEYHARGFSFEALSLWAQICEWLLMHDRGDFHFERILALWRALGSGERIYEEFFRFFIEEWENHGIHPALDRCAFCSRDFGNERRLEGLKFSFHHHGLIHGLCGSGLVVNEEVEAFLKLRESEKLSKEAIASLSQIVVPFVESQVGKTFKSRWV